MGFFGRLRTVANKAEALNAAISSTTIVAKIMSEAPAIYTPLKESWEVTMLSGTKLTLDQLLGQMVRVERQHQLEKGKKGGVSTQSCRISISAAHCYAEGGGAHRDERHEQQREHAGRPQQANTRPRARASSAGHANVGF